MPSNKKVKVVIEYLDDESQEVVKTEYFELSSPTIFTYQHKDTCCFLKLQGRIITPQKGCKDEKV